MGQDCVVLGGSSSPDVELDNSRRGLVPCGSAGENLSQVMPAYPGGLPGAAVAMCCVGGGAAEDRRLLAAAGDDGGGMVSLVEAPALRSKRDRLRSVLEQSLFGTHSSSKHDLQWSGREVGGGGVAKGAG